MEICVCKYCGKLFHSHMRSTTCRDCVHLDNSKFKKIEDYLIKHPGSNAIQLAGGLNVKVSEIIDYINEGRLEVINDKINIRSIGK